MLYKQIYIKLNNWNKEDDLHLARGQPGGQSGVRYGSAIVFTVFETFLNGQTVFRYVSKRVRNTLKRCPKGGQPGVTRGQPGFTRGSGRGQPGVKQGSPGGQPGISQGSAKGQPEVNQVSLVHFHTTKIIPS